MRSNSSDKVPIIGRVHPIRTSGPEFLPLGKGSGLVNVQGFWIEYNPIDLSSLLKRDQLIAHVLLDTLDVALVRWTIPPAPGGSKADTHVRVF